MSALTLALSRQRKRKSDFHLDILQLRRAKIFVCALDFVRAHTLRFTKCCIRTVATAPSHREGLADRTLTLTLSLRRKREVFLKLSPPNPLF
jgi:hypothetical protein